MHWFFFSILCHLLPKLQFSSFPLLWFVIINHFRKRDETRDVLYVKRNIEGRSPNHCCSGTAISYIFWVCVCSLRYPACNAHTSYCHLWPAPLYNIFPHYLINGRIFGKKLRNTKCVLIFSTTFVWNISHYKNKWERYYHKCILVFM